MRIFCGEWLAETLSYRVFLFAFLRVPVSLSFKKLSPIYNKAITKTALRVYAERLKYSVLIYA